MSLPSGYGNGFHVRDERAVKTITVIIVLFHFELLKPAFRPTESAPR